MMQASRWLLLAMALVLLPQAAFAQKKKLPKDTDAAAAGKPVDLDSDQSAQTPAPAATDQAAPGPVEAVGTPTSSGGGVDICQITPDAPQCQAAKEFNLGAEAKKEIRSREIYAVQQQYVIKAQRFEIMPYFAITENDQFVSHNAPGLALNYYITQVLAIGVNGNWYDGLNEDSDFNFQNRRAARIAVPLNDYQLSGDLNFTYVPMYGKFAGFGDFIFHYDAYVEGGVGLIRTKPISIIDPDNRSFPTWNNLVNFDVGIGLRIFFNRWLAAIVEVRDLIYSEKLENKNIDQLNPTNQAEWYDTGTHITNDVQLQFGLSIFLPTSFDYRLPK